MGSQKDRMNYWNDILLVFDLLICSFIKARICFIYEEIYMLKEMSKE